MNELNNNSSSPQEKLRFWLRVGLGLRLVPEIWNILTAFRGGDVPGLFHFLFIAATLTILWFLAQHENFARRTLFVMAIFKLLILPESLRSSSDLLIKSFGYLSVVIVVAELWNIFVIGLAFLLLRPEYRALFIKTPPKAASRYVLAAAAGIALLMGVIWSLPSTKQRYASWQAGRKEGWHQDAQKITNLSLPKWVGSPQSRVLEGFRVIEFNGWDSGQKIVLLIGDIAKPIPTERLMQLIDRDHVPKVLSDYPSVIANSRIMIQDVRFPDSRIGDKTGGLAHWYTNDQRIAILGYAPVLPTLGLEARRPFSIELFKKFIIQLISQNPLSSSDLGVAELISSANNGDVIAQYQLGVRHWLGRGVRQDDLEALNWFQKAGNSGLSQAQFNAGWAYKNGFGVKPDLAAATEWFEKAAYLNHPGAQLILGVQNFNEVVPPNLSKAYFWLTLAKSSYVEGATFACEQIKKKLTIEEISEIEQQAGMITAISASSNKKSLLPLIVPDESL